MTKKNTISAVESIEKQIAELSALKEVAEFIQQKMEAASIEADNYETQIFEAEAEGGKVEEWDWRRAHIKNCHSQAAAFQSVLDKLIK